MAKKGAKGRLKRKRKQRSRKPSKSTPLTSAKQTIKPTNLGERKALRTIVFIDYWNLQLSLQQEDAKSKGVPQNNHRFSIDWFNIGPWITKKAEDSLKGTGITSLSYQETRIYTSANPNDNGSFKKWVNNTLNRQPGIRTFCLDRKPKRHNNCAKCHQPIDKCPDTGCGEPINATQEKGVDTLLVTDLLCLGLDNTYDIAILISQDSDMKPAVEHLNRKGIKVVHAGIKHFGADLAKSCWSGFDLFPLRAEIERT